MNIEIQHETIHTNGITLHVASAGPTDGPPVILLHGFPDFWYGWHRQIPALAEAGFRVLAPDQRGCNLSEKPRGIRAYAPDQLAADVIGLADHYGLDRVRLVGHDWGGMVSWYLAMTVPERLHRMVILNVPHPSVMRRTLQRSFSQLRKSWYIFLFQLPWLPEASFRARDWEGGLRALRASAQRGTFTKEDYARYREAWAQPGAITGMFNWYRALMRVPLPRPAGGTRVRVPTRILWGCKDIALDAAMAQPSLDRCDEGDLHFFEQATHWVQHDEAAEVNRLIIEWLGM